MISNLISPSIFIIISYSNEKIFQALLKLDYVKAFLYNFIFYLNRKDLKIDKGFHEILI